MVRTNFNTLIMKRIRFVIVLTFFCIGMSRVVSQTIPATTNVKDIFSEVRLNGNMVYPVFNKSTAKVIKHDVGYQSQDVFHDGIFTLDTREGIGFLDAQGNILPGGFQWSRAWDNFLPLFSNGYAIVTKKKQNPFIGRGYDIEQFVIDKKGVTKKITSFGEIYGIGKFNKDGIAAITINGTKSRFRTAFINTKGQPVYRNLWRDEVRLRGVLGEFCDGLALYLDAATCQYGFVNRQGQIVIKPQYDDASGFSEGLAVVMKTTGSERKYVFINTKGQQAIQRTFTNKPESFSCGYSVVKKTDGSYVMIDKDGNVKSPAYKAATSFYPWGKAIVQKDGEVYVIDKSFNNVGSLSGELYYFGETKIPFVTEDGLIFQNNKIYDFDGNNRRIMCYGNYSLIGAGLAKVEFGNSIHDAKIGFVNLKTGKLVCYFDK